MAGIDEDIDRRLWNWARSVHGESSGGLGYGACMSFIAAMGGSRSAYREAVIPTNDAEAVVTGAAVGALDAELSRTVHEYYLRPGTQFAVAHALGISERTLRDRLARAHAGIRRWLCDRVDRLAQERARVEQLQRKAAA